MLRLYIYSKGDFEGGDYVVLPDNISFSVHRVNSIFNLENGGEFSEKIKLSASANKHLLGVTEHLNGETVYKALNGKRFLLYVSGVASMNGRIYMDNEAGIEGDEFEIELTGANTDFDDMISNMNCRDVQVLPDKPQVGEENYEEKLKAYNAERSALYIGKNVSKLKVSVLEKLHVLYYSWHKEIRANSEGKINIHINAKGVDYGKDAETPYNKQTYLEYELPSKGLFMFEGANFSEEYTNTESSKVYFCNVRVCGQRYIPVDKNGEEVEGDNPDIIEDWKEQRKWMSSDGATGEGLDNYGVWNKWGMAPSFYVLYFLEKLFSQLGLQYDISKLLAIEDLKRLAFVNTNPQFDTDDTPNPEKGGYVYIDAVYKEGGINPTMRASFDISSALDFNAGDGKSEMKNEVLAYFGGRFLPRGVDFEAKTIINHSAQIQVREHDGNRNPVIGNGVIGFAAYQFPASFSYTVDTSSCYANSNNFPDTGVSDVLTALQNAFGFRFQYDSETGSVTCLFVDEWLQEEQTPIELNAQLIDEPFKQDYGVDGYKLKYSATDDVSFFTFYKDGEKIKVPKNVIKNGQYNYSGDSTDDDFNYKVFLDDKISKSTVANDIYKNYATQYVTPTEKRVMIDQTTGKAYRVRIDEESEKVGNGLTKSANPSLFEVGEFIPAEYGDCNNEDRVKEVEISFNPVIMTNISEPDDPKYALAIDGEWRRPSAVDFEITHETSNTLTEEEINRHEAEAEKFARSVVQGDITSGRENLSWYSYSPNSKILFSSFIRFNALLNYDMGGNCPIYDTDMGFTLGIMRGGGKEKGNTEEMVVTKADADGFGNSYIDFVQTHGYAEFHSDSIDDLGRVWDYNGDEEGVSTTEDGAKTMRVDMGNVTAAAQWAMKGCNVSLHQVMFRYSYIDVLESSGWKKVLLGQEDEEGARALSTLYSCIPCVGVWIKIGSMEVVIYLSYVNEKGEILPPEGPEGIREYAGQLESRISALSSTVQQDIVNRMADSDILDHYLRKLDDKRLFVCSASNTAAVRFMQLANNLWFGQGSVDMDVDDIVREDIINWVRQVTSGAVRGEMVRTWGEMASAGWVAGMGDRNDSPMVAMTTSSVGSDECIFLLVDKSGNMVSKSDFNQYMSEMKSAAGSSLSAARTWDASRKGLLVDANEAMYKIGDNVSRHLYPLLHYGLMYGSGNALKIQKVTDETLKGRISLMIKAEKPKSDINGKRTGEYFGATGVGASKRGLFDKYHSRLAYFLTHCKKVTLPVDMSLQEFLKIDMTKLYTICGVTGYISEYECKYTNNGISGVEITMLYL